jgi:Protein of unknown function (DUF2934)
MQIKGEDQEKTLSQKQRGVRSLEDEVMQTNNPEANYNTDVYDKVAQLAYFKAEQRGFMPGYELDDWLDAEKEVGIKH